MSISKKKELKELKEFKEPRVPSCNPTKSIALFVSLGAMGLLSGGILYTIVTNPIIDGFFKQYFFFTAGLSYLCVGIAFLFILFSRLFVIQGQLNMPENYDNKTPRKQQASLTGWAERALGAHNNHIEAFAPFAAAILISNTCGLHIIVLVKLAVTFVIVRFIYQFLYLFDIDYLRTLVWLIGFLANCALFFMPFTEGNIVKCHL